MSIQHTDEFFQRLLFLHLFCSYLVALLPATQQTHIHTQTHTWTPSVPRMSGTASREKLQTNGGGHEIQENESITAWMEWNILRSCVSILAAIKITSYLFYLEQMIPFSVSWIKEKERCLFTRARVYLIDAFNTQWIPKIATTTDWNRLICARSRDEVAVKLMCCVNGFMKLSVKQMT